MEPWAASRPFARWTQAFGTHGVPDGASDALESGAKALRGRDPHGNQQDLYNRLWRAALRQERGRCGAGRCPSTGRPGGLRGRVCPSRYDLEGTGHSSSFSFTLFQPL